MTAKIAFKSVDEYIATHPKDVQAILQRVRSTIRAAMPSAEEVISYQIPAYKLPGGVVLWFAGWKQHYSLYPATGRLVEAFKDDLAPYRVNKGTIRFPLSQPVPVELIERFIKFRAKEVAERDRVKASTKMPKLVNRRAQPYVAIRRQVAMREIAIVLPPLLNDVFVWLTKKGIQPAGAPFWRYLVVDMKGELEIDVAVPVAVAPPSDNHIVVDVLPAGRYATVLHSGHPDGLQKATAELLAWAKSKDIGWQMNRGRWGGRVERYLTDPASEPDVTKWQTELAFLTTKGKEKPQTPQSNRTAPAARVTVKNVNHPGQANRVERPKYDAMKKALLTVLPRKAPGLTYAEMSRAVKALLPSDLFPGGTKAGWWTKTVQLDLEAKGVVVRERGVSPLQWRRTR
jgi:uncharacterized protein YdhG (YjbR/CyaY superfamily)/effector-binding domain-containing protein